MGVHACAQVSPLEKLSLGPVHQALARWQPRIDALAQRHLFSRIEAGEEVGNLARIALLPTL
jgi:hypothetical protein